jgi:hypothetical protein
MSERASCSRRATTTSDPRARCASSFDLAASVGESMMRVQLSQWVSPTPEVVPQSGMREDQMNDTNDFVNYPRRHP